MGQSILMLVLDRFLAKLVSRFKRRSFALNHLDLKLKPYLDFTGGIFVEAGANDGISQSNTLYFERYRNWSGILIEPIPELAEQCRVNRPGCIVENCALVPHDYAHSYVEMRYCNLMSLVKGAMHSKEEEEDHIARGREIQDVDTYELKAPARTLSSVLDQHAVAGVDFFSLDVEGFELAVLRGIDFDRHRPTFMLIEARYRDEIDAYLTPIYEAIAELSHHDVLYRIRGN